ncbi:MAG: vanadium-dependent haloperoxidase [Planctomycetota bacterium]
MAGNTTTSRTRESLAVRKAAAELAADRPVPVHLANGDEQRYASAHYAMSFTKGLEHTKKSLGLIEEPTDFEAYRSAIDNGFIDPFTAEVRPAKDKQRAWEAPTAGVVFDLQGPDAQAVTMAPAPALGSAELEYEMAEVYELAALRDEPLSAFEGSGSDAVNDSIKRLNALRYPIDGSAGRARTTNDDGKLDPQTVFRGSSPGVGVGPYLSQFMFMGNAGAGLPGVLGGRIRYGAQAVDQRVPVAAKKDYMISEDDWIDVQNGKNVRDNNALFDAAAAGGLDKVPTRFMTTPRDLATYVHDDQLYQAYLNACLILLSMRSSDDPSAAMFDQSFAKLSGEGRYFLNSFADRQLDRLEHHGRAAGGFALYGGPHILSLVTEIATRGLKAVRYQKFNNHIRLRPEALAGRLQWADQIEEKFSCVAGRFSLMKKNISDSIEAAKSASGSKTHLLPMAFQEGSPMHPAYGAGHATVAGACVTILKAFFDTDAILVQKGKTGEPVFRRMQLDDLHKGGDDAYRPVQMRPSDDGSSIDLEPIKPGDPCLTLEGELNKLAANISIGRNMAGVHYYSDYFDSARMGEEIAIGMLEEQALCYPTDPFVLSVPTFDGGVRRIGAR